MIARRARSYRFAASVAAGNTPRLRPPRETVDTPIGPLVYRSDRLAERLGLKRLYIAFNGYAPSVGAMNMTGSFKDFEAFPSILYIREHGAESVILASAGNTARAFAYAATLLDFPVYIVAPEAMANHLWVPIVPSDSIRLIVVAGSNAGTGWGR